MPRSLTASSLTHDAGSPAPSPDCLFPPIHPLRQAARDVIAWAFAWSIMTGWPLPDPDFTTDEPLRQDSEAPRC